MNKKGPVVIIEDDLDDQDLIAQVFKDLQYENELRFFIDGEKALAYLLESSEVPFLILSDINLPKLDGFALRSKLKTDAALQLKCIPYLFFSTGGSQRAVIDAYSLSVQGFFEKISTMGELKEIVRVIMDYWAKCSAPNNFLLS